MKRPGQRQQDKQAKRGFTLLELLMALAASGVILSAIYGVFSRAVHLRDEATARTREARLQAHAASVIRDDLRHARISGGTLATVLTGSADGQTSSFPGYLKFTTTTARDLDDTPAADLQQIEYYIVDDTEATDRKAGLLVRAVDRNVLAPTRETPPEDRLLSGVEKLEIEFYDGDAWQDSWEVTDEDKTLPEAVRVRIQPAAAEPSDRVPPIEILVPWTTQAWIEK